jgi:hypothetical protein
MISPNSDALVSRSAVSNEAIRPPCGCVQATFDEPAKPGSPKLRPLALRCLDNAGQKIAISRHGPYASAGYYCGVVTGLGETMREAARSAYHSINRLSMPNSPFWRIDAGARLRKDLPRLQEYGFSQSMEY